MQRSAADHISHNHFPQRLLSRRVIIQDDVAEGQGDAAAALDFGAVDNIGFSGGDSVLPFVAGGTRKNDQTTLYEDDGFFLAGFGIGKIHDAA